MKLSKGLKQQIEAAENFNEADMKDVVDELFKGMSVEKIDGELTPEELEKMAKELFRNELVVTQWENTSGNTNVAYTINTHKGNLTTGLEGLKNTLDNGTIFTHVVFNGSELDEEATVEFWNQYKEMINERLSKD